MERIAHTSRDYIEAARAKGENSRQMKQAHLSRLAKEANGFERVGQLGIVGPVMLRLKYEGISRNILQEDPLERGAYPFYDLQTHMGQCFLLEKYQSEAKITQFEGTRVTYDFIRFEAYPAIQKEDEYRLNIDMIENCQEESFQAIQRKEDWYLFNMLDVALAKLAAAGTPHEIDVTGGLLPQNLYDASIFSIDMWVKTANIVVCHPSAVRKYFYTWDLYTVGVARKDKLVDGTPVTTFGDFKIFESQMCPTNVMYVLPDPEYLGVMPILYSLDVVENPKPEKFQKGWVMDEMINMIILNPNGVARINLLDTEADPKTQNSTEAKLTSFSVTADDVTYGGTISESAKTVAVSLPHGTAVTALPVTFGISAGARAYVGTKVQVSGTTTDDFTSPVAFKVTAEDGKTTETYTVTVSVAAA